MLQMLVRIFHEEPLAVHVVEQLEVMVVNTGPVTVQIDSYVDVVNTGEEVECCSDEESLVMMVELVAGKDVVDAGKPVVGRHDCLEMVHNGAVVAECCSSMVVVKTCGTVLETSILAKVECCSDEESLVMMVELVAGKDVVDTGKPVVGRHGCLEMVHNGVVVANCCSSMVVVKTCGTMLETSILVEVECCSDDESLVMMVELVAG
jgi:hypothetical protein